MLERKIDILNEARGYSKITGWVWMGNPFSKIPAFIDTREDKSHFEEVDYIIRMSSNILAMTSPSSYIRECKKWYIKNA